MLGKDTRAPTEGKLMDGREGRGEEKEEVKTGGKEKGGLNIFFIADSFLIIPVLFSFLRSEQKVL